ncbi:LOW QUALITY PROTEIN: hypothetical protein CFOL_v3_21532, partial [Cephalotus follicularis]
MESAFIVSQSSSSFGYDYWRQNVYGGGWATLAALFIIAICHFFFVLNHKFINNSSSSSSSSSFSSSSSSSSSTTTASVTVPHQSLISDADLKLLIKNLEESENEIWESVIHKSNSLLSYTARCCRPEDGPLKYLSLTVFENCSPEILRDFYMDNEYRKQWDKTMVQHEQLQLDTTNGIEIGRTIKKFPFLTPREYILAWRLWEGNDKTFYCFIKASECEHPSARRQRKYVRVEFFRSGWRISKGKLPGRNACEIMFHQEDAGLNVEMAKLVFAKGIWSYVCKMDNALRKYSTMSSPQTSPVDTAVTLIKKVPPGIDTTNSVSCSATPVESAVGGLLTGEVKQKKFSRRPSKKLIANGLLLLGGVICLSRGHSSLRAKVAMAYILTKLSKRGALSSQS